MMIMNGSDVMSPGGGAASLPTSSNSPSESGFSQLQMTSNGPPLCTGCGHVILDEFILRVQGRLWHSACLRCCVCHEVLNQTCFARGTQVFCQKDFFRLLGTRCAGCGGGIPPTENVRRAHENIYHVRCFTCVACDSKLETGDEFYLRDDGRLICSQDYHSDKHTGEQEVLELQEKKSRTSLTDLQTDILTTAFTSCSKPSRQMRERLSGETGLDQRVIQVWFQNKRAKCKRDHTDPSDGNNNACADQPEVHLGQVAAPPGGFPLPIVNGDFLESHRQPQTPCDFSHLAEFLNVPLSAIGALPWSATPDMWDANFVPPNVDLDPADIKDGEVCSKRRGDVTWETRDQLVNCRQ
ncbi:LIM/homeobox protein Lhx3-like [Haliotis rufescens]|uniref:LIM/homeobox protein Lhx3-like n=1 Tax=Haliotis rufescens TaxID=6454 RepID=UPI00201F1462|nr:LIM/homeobox protein Lhx3-like [Haliotis rufescens]